MIPELKPPAWHRKGQVTLSTYSGIGARSSAPEPAGMVEWAGCRIHLHVQDDQAIFIQHVCVPGETEPHWRRTAMMALCLYECEWVRSHVSSRFFHSGSSATTDDITVYWDLGGAGVAVMVGGGAMYAHSSHWSHLLDVAVHFLTRGGAS